jgi:SAM-dependent methyltransferase
MHPGAPKKIHAPLASLMDSTVVKECQVCRSPELRPIIFLGYVPPLNRLYPVNERPRQESFFPAQALYCAKCHLVQLGLMLSRDVLFPPDYPYVSGTTRVQREDFAELCRESKDIASLRPEDLIVDVGSNNGTLLTNLKLAGHRVLGIEPTLTANLALERGIPTLTAFLEPEVARQVRKDHGPARVVIATNLLAHVPDIHDLLESMLTLLDEKGVFIAEVQDLLGVVEKLQYDSFYHEHMRYYSLESLLYLLSMHGLEVFHAKRIPTHGGSLRVYAARRNAYAVRDSVARLLAEDAAALGSFDKLKEFSQRAMMAKLELQSALFDIKRSGKRIFAVGAASRAIMLVNYLALDNGILDCVVEIPGSSKIGTYMPGTLIPIVEESRLWVEQPNFALLLSWHVADDLIPKLTEKGFSGDYLVPLPRPAIVRA